MKNRNDTQFNFDGAIITPLKIRQKISLSLDEDVVAYLRELAAKTKQPFDNVINHIVTDLLSEHLDLSEVTAKTLKAVAKSNNHIILMEGSKPFARVEIIDDKDQRPIFDSKVSTIPTDQTSAKFKAPDFRYECECASAAISAPRKARQRHCAM
ncbi:MAG: hypothetical protein J5700_06555 [Treponema sp.]|nr:hypothetical protein [Treponema sp.]